VLAGRNVGHVCANGGVTSAEPGIESGIVRYFSLGSLVRFGGRSLVALDIADIQFTGDGVVITIRRSKTDQEGAGRTVGLPYGSNPETSP
jgi:hypothetical protein